MCVRRGRRVYKSKVTQMSACICLSDVFEIFGCVSFLDLRKKVTNKQQDVQTRKNHLRTIESDKISNQK
jgi:hypothetical protein